MNLDLNPYLLGKMSGSVLASLLVWWVVIGIVYYLIIERRKSHFGKAIFNWKVFSIALALSIFNSFKQIPELL